MSTQRFTPEFKEEAVRQIIDRKVVIDLHSRKVVGESIKPTLARVT